MNIKRSLRRIINSLGYDIRALTVNYRRIRTTIGESYSLVRGLGFSPKTIVDVGVATGTEILYGSFPDSYILLIEPLKEFEPDLKEILKRYDGSYLLAAAGSSTGQVQINVHKDHLDGSSLFKESMGIEADGYERTVPMFRVDDILNDKQINGPYLIKIDVQGAELEVLEGCKSALLQTEVIVLEVSMFAFMKGAPQFYDVVKYMKDHGFVAYDIILGWNRPLDNALGQIDIVFVQENGMFRRDHSYSTVEQMQARKAWFGS